MSAPHSWTDSITVLRSQPGVRLAKSIAPDGTCADYDSAKHYRARSVPVSSLLDVGELLRELIPLSNRCVVRGEPIAGGNREYMRRLAYRDQDTGDDPTLAEQPRRWLALDADGIARPEHVKASDLVACGDLALELLPRPFQVAACIVQASANHGIKPGCRLRLWFWCDRPMSGRELTMWLRGCPLDMSVFRTAQPIYTAAPIFTGGREDHLPMRMIELPGEDWLRCPSVEDLAAPPPALPTPPEKVATGAVGDAYVRAALVRAADAIATAGEGSRHDTIVSESRGLARLVRAGLLLERDLIAVVTRAAERAGKVNGDEIASCIAWGLKNPSNGVLPENRHAA